MDRKPIDFVAILTEAMRYWEKKRLLFTAVLTVVFFLTRRWSPITELPEIITERPKILLYLVIVWILLGTLANALYCVCYLPEIAFQISDLREVWKQYRWLLFSLLTVVGSILAWLIPMVWGL